MIGDIGKSEMKEATENAVALLAALQSDVRTLDGQLKSAVEWVGVEKTSVEGRRLALQLNQSAYLTKLAIELVAQAGGMSVPEATQRFATLIAKHNLEN